MQSEPRFAMRLPVLLVTAGLVAASVGIGCGSTKDQGEPPVIRTFIGETKLYRVVVDERERAGYCVRRTVLFTSHNRLYTQPHLDRVRAVDEGCDASSMSNFERVEVLRSPQQQDRYQNDFSFRNRINEDLWDAYETSLFKAERQRRRAREE